MDKIDLIPGAVGRDAFKFSPLNRSKEWPCEKGWYIHSTNVDILGKPDNSIQGSSGISGRWISYFWAAQSSDWKVVTESITSACGDPLTVNLGWSVYKEKSTGGEVGGGLSVEIPIQGIEISISGNRAWTWGDTEGEGSYMENALGPYQKPCRAFKVKILALNTVRRMVHWRSRLDSVDAWTKVSDKTQEWYEDKVGYTVCAKVCAERADPHE